MNTISRRQFVAASLSAAVGVALSACSTNSPVGEGSDTKAGKKVKMQAILISSASQVTAAQGNHMVDYAKDKGIDFSVEYFDQSVSTEATLIENASQAGVDVLILQNQSDGDCVDQINEAVKNGMVVLLFATDIPDANYTLLYGEDSHAAGVKMAEMAADWAQENIVDKGGKIICALGNYSVSPIATARMEGVKEGITKAFPDIDIVGTYDMAYKEEGLKVGENLLQAHPDVNLVLGINDQSTCGVMEAFEAAGKTPDDCGMFGIDGTPEGMLYIAQDTMFHGTVAIPTNEVSEKLMDIGIEIMNGDDTYKKGGKTELYWESKQIDKSNVDDYKDVWGSLAK